MTDPRCGEHGVLKTTCAGWKHYEKGKQTVEYWREKARVTEAELDRLHEALEDQKHFLYHKETTA